MRTFALLLVAAAVIVTATVLLRRTKPILELQPGDLDLLRKLPQQMLPKAESPELLRLWKAGLVDTVDVEGDFSTSYLFVLSDRGRQVLSAAS